MRKGQLGTRCAWEEVNEGDQSQLSGSSLGGAVLKQGTASRAVPAIGEVAQCNEH